MHTRAPTQWTVPEQNTTWALKELHSACVSEAFHLQKVWKVQCTCIWAIPERQSRSRNVFAVFLRTTRVLGVGKHFQVQCDSRLVEQETAMSLTELAMPMDRIETGPLNCWMMPKFDSPALIVWTVYAIRLHLSPLRDVWFESWHIPISPINYLYCINKFGQDKTH